MRRRRRDDAYEKFPFFFSFILMHRVKRSTKMNELVAPPRRAVAVAVWKKKKHNLNMTAFIWGRVKKMWKKRSARVYIRIFDWQNWNGASAKFNYEEFNFIKNSILFCIQIYAHLCIDSRGGSHWMFWNWLHTYVQYRLLCVCVIHMNHITCAFK